MNRPSYLDSPSLQPETVARNLARYFELAELSMELALAVIRYRYPNATPTEVREHFLGRLARSRREKWREWRA
jgi:hypothetical protein